MLDYFVDNDLVNSYFYSLPLGLIVFAFNFRMDLRFI